MCLSSMLLVKLGKCSPRDNSSSTTIHQRGNWWSLPDDSDTCSDTNTMSNLGSESVVTLDVDTHS